MATSVGAVPEILRPQVEAAVTWLSREQGRDFHASGMLDPAAVVAERERLGAEGSLVLPLVLCEGDLCLRENLRIRAVGSGFDVGLLAPEHAAPGQPSALLDPPPGVRSGWLAPQLERHRFVLLLFYRGFW